MDVLYQLSYIGKRAVTVNALLPRTSEYYRNSPLLSIFIPAIINW
jgi:hypothetical protein